MSGTFLWKLGTVDVCELPTFWGICPLSNQGTDLVNSASSTVQDGTWGTVGSVTYRLTTVPPGTAVMSEENLLGKGCSIRETPESSLRIQTLYELFVLLAGNFVQ